MNAKPQAAEITYHLAPRCALDKRGVKLVLGGLLTLTALIAAYMVSLGAWPVLGFLGLELVVVYWMLKTTYERSRKPHESLYLNERALRLEDHKDETRNCAFKPGWARVTHHIETDNTGHIEISQSGQSVTFGTFLSLPEQQALVMELQDKLQNLKAAA